MKSSEEGFCLPVTYVLPYFPAKIIFGIVSAHLVQERTSFVPVWRR